MNIDAAMKKIEEICLSFEGAKVKQRRHYPEFHISGKMFAAAEANKDGVNLAFALSPDTQKSLLKNKREFSKTHYVGKYGWVTWKLRRKIPWAEVKKYLKGSFELQSKSQKPQV